MHNHGNVVPLYKATTDHTTRAPLARLPVILLQVRDKATQQLRHGLQELFDKADDTLFEMADRARNDVDQNIFFEAMRDLRLKRKSIERLFFEQFFEAFISLTQFNATHTILPTVLPGDTGAAQTDDQPERKVAVEAMVNKVLSRDGFALDQLTARLSMLLGRSLMEQHNPMGPTMLCKFFLRAGRNLGMEIKVKLIILKLFDRYVLSSADQLYASANQLLIATGVLPDMKPVPTRWTMEPVPADPVQAQLDDAVPEAFAALQELLPHARGKSRVVGEADDDVIYLISMLFDSILDDPYLPQTLKVLLARLQIPMVKIALLDKSFFSRSSHPARRLLNEIANAALGWSECADQGHDSLYVRIEQVMQRLLSEFVDDPAIFSELLAEFLAFTSDERRHCELLEQRLRDAEEGRARTALARQCVEGALNHALLGNVLPQSVLMFVRDAWSKVLLLTCLKYGDQSAQWHADVQTLEQLIWSVRRHDEPDASSRLLELVPALLKALRDGLSGSAFDSFATSGFFSELESVHVQMFERREFLPANAPVMIEVLERIVLPNADEGLVETALVRLSADDSGLLQVDLLRPGAWVEFRVDPENTLRCQLAAIIEASGQYVFVDRTGMKVLERNRPGLALEFRRGAVHTLDDTLLFDRAMALVIGHLRRLKRGK